MEKEVEYKTTQKHHYKILHAYHIAELEKEVMEYLEEGWLLVGGVSAVNKVSVIKTLYIQAVRKFF